MRGDRAAALLDARAPGTRLVLAGTVGSTSDEAARLAGELAPPFVVAAEGQTAGRGRGGSAWHSPAGESLYCTLCADAGGLAPGETPFLTLAAGVGLHREVARLAGGRLGLKWPNDLYLNGRKVAGILCELVETGDGERRVLVGAGLNVNAERFPEGLREKATSLRLEEGRLFDLEELLAAAAGGMLEAIEECRAGGRERLRAEFRERCTFWGRRVEVAGLRGAMTDITPAGALVLALDDGTLAETLSGSVELLQPET